MSKSINSMTAKNVRYAIDKGVSIEELLEKYACSEEEFDRRLALIYKYEHVDMKAKIIKAASKKKGKKKVNVSSPDPEEKTDIRGIPAPEQNNNDESLESLRTKEESLSHEIIVLEGDLKAIDDNAEQINSRTTKINDAVSALMTKLNAYNEELMGLLDEKSSLMERKDNTILTIRKLKKELADTRARISELTKIHLLVHLSGDFELPNGEEDMVLDSLTGFTDKLVELVGMSELSEINVLMLRTIAMTLCVLQNSDREFILEFDNDELEIAFHITSEILKKDSVV